MHSPGNTPTTLPHGQCYLQDWAYSSTWLSVPHKSTPPSSLLTPGLLIPVLNHHAFSDTPGLLTFRQLLFCQSTITTQSWRELPSHSWHSLPRLFLLSCSLPSSFPSSFSLSLSLPLADEFPKAFFPESPNSKHNA